MKPAAAALAVVLAACAPPRPPAWLPADPAFVAEGAGYEVVPPPGWMRLNAPDRDVLLVTRDGTPLQRILVSSSPVGQPLGMGGGKRAVVADMSAQELAELVLDDMRAADGLTDLQVLESAPAVVAGRDGFRLLVTHRDASGLRRRVAFLGLQHGDRFFRMMYVAPERHYFGADLAAFEEMARTFRVRPAPAAAAAAP